MIETVYGAVREMRRLSAEEKEFAFSYMSYSITKDKSDGEVVVEHAILYKKPKDTKNNFQEYMLTYLNTDTGEVRHCWLPLIMSYNHQPLKSID